MYNDKKKIARETEEWDGQMKESFISQTLLFQGSGNLLKLVAVFNLGINFTLGIKDK